MDKANPTYEDESPVNVFDLWEGANFKIRMRKKDGFTNYDESLFMEPSPVADTDEEILEVVKKQYPLREFLDPKNFKSYDELKKKLDSVLSNDSYTGTAAKIAEQEPELEAPVAQSVRQKPAPEPKSSKAGWDDEDEEDDMKSFFAKIADEDD